MATAAMAVRSTLIQMYRTAVVAVLAAAMLMDRRAALPEAVLPCVTLCGVAAMATSSMGVRRRLHHLPTVVRAVLSVILPTPASLVGLEAVRSTAVILVMQTVMV